jgi:hypothetical protein
VRADHFQRLRYYSGAAGALLVFDLTLRSSFDGL